MSVPSPLDAATADNARERRVGLYVMYEFHRAFVEPVHALLKNDLPCLLTADPKALVDYQPHVLIMSDSPLPELRLALPRTMFVSTRHGFGSKNYANSHFAAVDFVCLSSPWVREDCIAHACQPRLGFWITGFIPMDPLLRRPAIPDSQDLPADFAESGPTLLYAPTYNLNLRSVELLGADWIARLREAVPGMKVILKPHPHTVLYPQAMAILQDLARRHDRTLLLDPDRDVYPFLAHADLLLTDSSSVMFYFLAMDRPVVVVNNPARFQDRYFDPQGPEWTWRDLALQIDRAEELPGAVCRSLRHPEEKAAQRALYRERLYGDLVDGRAAERLAAKVRALLQPAAEDRDWVELAWNSLATQSRLLAEARTRRALPKSMSISLSSFPALRAALARSPQCEPELQRLLDMVLTGELGQAMTLGQRPPAKRTSSP